MSGQDVQTTLDHFFRREHGLVVAYLTKYLGPGKIELAENFVQEAFIKAIQTWPLQGIPENPKSWILKVSKNLAIDHIRANRKTIYLESQNEIDIEAMTADAENTETLYDNELQNNELKLMFICCHPILNLETQIALTLKTICGFSVAEIARAFFTKEETIAQRIVRAKQKIADENLKFEDPDANEIRLRVDSVLKVLYLMFNEGYLATEGAYLTRKDLCDEAIFRLTQFTKNKAGQTGEAYALLSLMHFQISRFSSRVDTNGELLLLEDQDRNLWDQIHIRQGLEYLNKSAIGNSFSSYHLQAGIASSHSLAETFKKTNWQQILLLYDMMLDLEDSEVIKLNRLVAVAMISGYQTALDEYDQTDFKKLKNNYLLYAVKAEFHYRLKQNTEAKSQYLTAASLCKTEVELKHIQKRISACDSF